MTDSVENVIDDMEINIISPHLEFEDQIFSDFTGNENGRQKLSSYHSKKGSHSKNKSKNQTIEEDD